MLQYYFNQNIYSINYTLRGYSYDVNSYKFINSLDILVVKTIFSFFKSLVPLFHGDNKILYTIIWLNYLLLITLVILSMWINKRHQKIRYFFFVIVIMVLPIGLLTLTVENYVTYDRLRFSLLVPFMYLATKNLNLSEIIFFLKKK